MPALLASALFHWPCSISIHFVSLSDFFTFVSQVRCLRCWRPPFFYSFVSQAISLLLSPRFGACTAGVRLFPLAMQHFYSVVSRVIFLPFVSQVRCLRCWRPPFFYSFVSQAISLLLSPRFGACTAGVRLFPLAMQHFYSVVSHVILLTFVSQVQCLQCWCPPFSAGHAAFLFICLPCDFFTFASRFGACAPGVRPFPLAMQHFYSFVSHVISLLVSQVRWLHCWHRSFSAGLAAFLFSCVSQVISSALPSCWSLCPPSCWSLCPSCLPSVSFCLPSCWSLSALSPFYLALSPVLTHFLLVTVSVLSPFCFLFLFPFLLIIVSVLSPFCFLLSPFLSPFLLVIVSVLSLSSVSFCLPSCWSLSASSSFLSPMSQKMDLGMLLCCPTCLGSTVV